MSARALLNNPDQLVDDALAGLALAHPDLVRCHYDPTYVVRAHPAGDKVGLVSGGGSGHEPLHTGFVGPGMLDAAVPGAVFASPTAAQILAAIRAVDRGQGVLLIVKNYTGDVLNFSIAAELAADAGIAVRTVLVDDDLATDPAMFGRHTSEPDAGRPGRRGTAAVIAVEKIAGAAAEEGRPLDEVTAIARRVAHSARTVALAFAACTSPGHSRPAFELAPGEIEFGVGIHGERGLEVRPDAPAHELVEALAEPIVHALDLRRDDAVIAIVNGLGATTALELCAAHRDLGTYLDQHGVGLARSLVGSYVTSLDMRGCSITLLVADEDFLQLWDAPVRTPGLTW